jgi:transposase
MSRRVTQRRTGRRRFTSEFRAEAVGYLEAQRALGVPLAKIAQQLDVGPDLLRTWAKALRSSAAVIRRPAGETEATELARLRREVALLRQERDFLKKAAAYFAQGTPRESP